MFKRVRNDTDTIHCAWALKYAHNGMLPLEIKFHIQRYMYDNKLVFDPYSFGIMHVVYTPFTTLELESSRPNTTNEYMGDTDWDLALTALNGMK